MFYGFMLVRSLSENFDSVEIAVKIEKWQLGLSNLRRSLSTTLHQGLFRVRYATILLVVLVF